MPRAENFFGPAADTQNHHFFPVLPTFSPLFKEFSHGEFQWPHRFQGDARRRILRRIVTTIRNLLAPAIRLAGDPDDPRDSRAMQAGNVKKLEITTTRAWSGR